MATAWHALWGCGRGPVGRLAPEARLLAGGLVFAAALVAVPTTVAGAGVVGGATLAWLAACRPPLRVVQRTVTLGLVLFLPFLLLAPLVEPAEGAVRGAGGALAVPVAVVVRGMASLLVATATVTALPVSDLRSGLERLPVPRLVTAILLQIVHQTAALSAETHRIAEAMAVRGASGGGRAAWRVIVTLPRVWLPRVVGRAERVAAAMELRGYGEDERAVRPRARFARRDVGALALACVSLGAAIVARWWEGA